MDQKQNNLHDFGKNNKTYLFIRNLGNTDKKKWSWQCNDLKATTTAVM